MTATAVIALLVLATCLLLLLFGERISDVLDRRAEARVQVEGDVLSPDADLQRYLDKRAGFTKPDKGADQVRLTLPELAHMRLRLYPGGLWMTDPVSIADAVTSRADLRIAYAAARGRDLDHIDPTSGREPS